MSEAGDILRVGIAALSAPLTDDDALHGWTTEMQRIMVAWFRKMLGRLESGADLRGDYCKIARELDMSAIHEGRLHDACVDTQRRLIRLLGDGE